MKAFAKWCIVASLFTPVSVFAGKESNGGDVVKCVKSSDNAFEGLFSLDWMATYKSSSGNRDIVEVTSWEQSKNRILQLLKVKSPALASSFSTFLKYQENFDDFSAPKIWQERSFGLVPIDDQKLENLLPANCVSNVPNRERQIIQAVRRQAGPQLTTYMYDTDIYQNLKETRPIQFSFLMVHEWLWDLTNNVETIRNADRMFHSKYLDSYTADQLQTALMRLDLVRDKKFDTGFVPVCERSRPVRQLLELKLGKSCQEITTEDLKAIDLLDFKLIEPGPLQAGDLSGLNKLETIRIINFGLTEIPEKFFYYLPSLRSVSLACNLLTEIHKQDFTLENGLKWLDLSHNKIKSIDLTMDWKDFDENRLFLMDNNIRSIDDVKVINAVQISLSQNKIEVVKLKDSYLNNLKILDLGYNPILTFECGPFSQINFLSLEEAKFKKLERKMFRHCPLLENLNVSWMDLSDGIETGTFDDLLNLKVINLSHNRLSNVPSFIFENQVTTNLWVDLSDNLLTADLNPIVKDFEKRKFLEINLQRNNMSALPNWFENLGRIMFPYGGLGFDLEKLNFEQREWLRRLVETYNLHFLNSGS